MAYDDSYPTSDSEIIITNCDPINIPNGQKDFDYINDWVDLTVENEIWRGKKLREEKPLPDKTQRECDVINIDFLASFCNENQRHARKIYGKSKNDKISPCTPRSACRCPRSNSTSSAYSHRISSANTGRTKTKTPRKCSMRIAELAVPTKRQCIDTWRNKSYILPEFMVDRLKQHVLDQRPIVKIPEAIYCFQRKRPKSSKNFSTVQTKKEINCEVLKPYHEMDTRTLCIIFGHKIAKILSNPLNLTLNSDLENLSNIVASDIAQMISNSRQINSKHRQKELIYKDVSNKIAVWIAGILEDLSIKLLEEDLRVRKQNEANSKFAEQCVTVMETILQQEQRNQSTDLEEEEGPVLDFIDDLVDNVMNICEPTSVHIDEESYTSDSSQDDIVVEESKKQLTPNESSENMKIDQNSNTDSSKNSTEEINDLKENTVLNDAQHFRNELWGLIHNVNKNPRENISKSSRDEVEKENNQEISTEAEVENDSSGENINQMDNDTTNVIPNDENTDKVDNDTTIMMQNYENTDKIDDVQTQVIKKYEYSNKIDSDSINVIQNDEIDSDSINVIQNDEIDDDSKIVIQNNEIDDDSTNVIQNNEIDDDSTNVIQNNEIDDDSTNVIQNNEIDDDSTNVIQNNEIDDDSTNVIQNNEIDDDSTNVIQNNEIDDDTTNVMQNDERGESDYAEKNDSNVSEVFEIFTEDSGDEKNSKKVKFSLTDLVNHNKITKEIKSTMELPENDEPEQTQWSSSSHENVKSNIFFSEPNYHLLSDADESWPPELSERPILIISDSVSKSVTSLGNILENDEIQITPIENEANVIEQQKTGDTRLQEKVTINRDTSTQPTDKYDIGSQTNPAPKEGINESDTAASETTATKDDSKKVEDSNIDKSLIIQQPFEDEPVDIDTFSNQEINQTVLDESSLIKIENTANIGGTEGDIIPSHKTQSQINYSWKVHPNTAPSWVTAWSQGRGEPSEDSIPVQRKPTKMREKDMRKWCKDLEKAFINLEMWKNWIDNTCKETVILLKQKESACAALNRKGATNWIRHKRNIHKDAILWTKLHLRTEDNFKNLKRKYNNIEYSKNKTPTSDISKEIFQTMRDFENLSVMLHEMIVSAEYCAMCSCNKTKIRKNMNMEQTISPEYYQID